MPKGTKSQRRSARQIARLIEQEAKDNVSCNVDDWNDYGSFQIVVDYPRGEDPNLISLTPAIKRAINPFDNVFLDASYGEHGNGIEHPEKPEGWGTYRRRYSMVHIRVTK